MSLLEKIKYICIRYILLILKKSEHLSALSCRIVKLTGKHKDPIHPKHLVQVRIPWYLKYINKQDIVLDIGCNNGQHTIKTAKKCFRIIGIDKNENAIKLANNEIKRRKLFNINIINGDLEKRLPFSSKTFDKIIALDVFEHINKRRQLLREISRVLKNKGLILLSIPNSQTSWKRLLRKYNICSYSDPDHKIEFSQKQIIKLLKNFNIKVIDISPVVYDTPFVGFIDLIGGFSLSLYKKLTYWRRQKIMHNLQESIGMEIICRKI